MAVVPKKSGEIVLQTIKHFSGFGIIGSRVKSVLADLHRCNLFTWFPEPWAVPPGGPAQVISIYRAAGIPAEQLTTNI